MIISLIFVFNVLSFIFLLHVYYSEQYQENSFEEKLYISNIFGILSMIFNVISVIEPLMHNIVKTIIIIPLIIMSVFLIVILTINYSDILE